MPPADLTRTSILIYGNVIESRIKTSENVEKAWGRFYPGFFNSDYFYSALVTDQSDREPGLPIRIDIQNGSYNLGLKEAVYGQSLELEQIGVAIVEFESRGFRFGLVGSRD